MQVKGLALISCKNFVEKRFNQPDIEKFIKALDQETVLIYNNIVPNKFYPITTFIKINKAIVDIFNNGNISILKKLGRFCADEAVRGIYRVFFKFGTPQFIIRQAANVFSKYYDKGKLNILYTKNNVAAAELIGFNNIEDISLIKYVCTTIEGWIERSVEICSGKTTNTEHSKCTSKNEGSCIFTCKWGN